MEAQHNLQGSIEALLFAYGEPMALERLVALTGAKFADVEAAVNAIANDLDEDPSRGLAVLRHGASAQLVTHPRHAKAVAELLRGEMSQDLGPAAVETLALVAYFGPVARSVIDHVRGVSSALSLRTLLVRGMIERIREGKGEHKYQVTPELIREMGLTEREDLPDFEDLSALLTRSLAARETAPVEKPTETDAS